MLTFESLLPSKGTTGSRDFGNSFQFPLPSIYYHLFPYNIFNEQDIVFRFVDRIETIFIRRNLIHLRIFREDSSKKSSNILVTFPHSSYPPIDHCSRERQTSSRAISSIPVYTKSFQFWENSLFVIEPMGVQRARKPRRKQSDEPFENSLLPTHRFPCSGQTRPSPCVDTLPLPLSPEQNSFAPSTRHLYSH